MNVKNKNYFSMSLHSVIRLSIIPIVRIYHHLIHYNMNIYKLSKSFRSMARKVRSARLKKLMLFVFPEQKRVSFFHKPKYNIFFIQGDSKGNIIYIALVDESNVCSIIEHLLVSYHITRLIGSCNRQM